MPPAPSARFNFVVTHVIEPAASGRASCRGCGEKLAKGELRFGERVENPFGEGEATYWFHPLCAACMRPEPLLQALSVDAPALSDVERLRELAQGGTKHRRLPRLMRAERATSARARCRSCRESIGKGDWRLALAMFEDGRMTPIGFIHVPCAEPYFGTREVMDRVMLLSRGLSESDREELARLLLEPAPAYKPLAKTQGPDVEPDKAASGDD